MNAALSLIARICLAAVFLGSGVEKIGNIPGTVAAMEGVGMPIPSVLVFGAILVLLGGGINVILGWKTRVNAGLLMLFLVLATYYFHPAWRDETQVIPFMKNLSMFGGMLFLVANGPGLLSVDGRLATTHDRTGEEVVGD